MRNTCHGIKPRDRLYPASALPERVRNFWDIGWIGRIDVPRPGNARRDVSQLLIGPITSSNKVVALAKLRRNS